MAAHAAAPRLKSARVPDLVSLLARRSLIVAPGAFDVLSARLIAARGFPAVYLTGYGTTASLLGRPDIGFITLPDICGVVRAITQTVAVPLIADAESGFGNAVNLVRTVRELEMAGASAIHLEDQVVPRRFAGEATPPVVPAVEHAATIRLAARSRRSDRFLIIGRTDCLQRLGLPEAIRRGNAYRRAGADIIFVHGISTTEELREVGKAVQGPKLVNYSALTLSGSAAPPGLADLQRWGYRIVIFAIEPLFAAARAVQGALDVLARARTRSTSPARELRSLMMAREEIEQVLGAPGYADLAQRFLPRAPGPGESPS